jgi:hypothetical protein
MWRLLAPYTLLFLLLSSVAQAATLVQTATGVSAAAQATTAPSITITGTTVGNTLTCFASIYDADLDFTLTDTTDGANTFTSFVGENHRTGPNASLAIIAVAPIGTGGDRTVAFNLSSTSVGSNRYYELGCLEWQGSFTIDTSALTHDFSTTTADVNVGPITPSGVALIVGIASASTSDTTFNWGSPGPWTTSYRQNDSNTTVGIDAGYWDPGIAVTAYTPQWAHDNISAEASAALVALIPTSAGDVEGCYLMENGTDFYLMENNTDFYALEGGDGGLCGGAPPAATFPGWHQSGGWF